MAFSLSGHIGPVSEPVCFESLQWQGPILPLNHWRTKLIIQLNGPSQIRTGDLHLSQCNLPCKGVVIASSCESRLDSKSLDHEPLTDREILWFKNILFVNNKTYTKENSSNFLSINYWKTLVSQKFIYY